MFVLFSLLCDFFPKKAFFVFLSSACLLKIKAYEEERMLCLRLRRDLGRFQRIGEGHDGRDDPPLSRSLLPSGYDLFIFRTDGGRHPEEGHRSREDKGGPFLFLRLL